jgi:phosphate transport system substrate-binding protein
MAIRTGVHPRSLAALGALGALALALACGRRPPAPAPEVVYDGATSIADRIMAPSAAPFRERTGVTLRIRRSGSGKGLAVALSGAADVAGVARSLTAEELGGRPYFQIVGYDALAVFVHESNPVRALTMAQARDLFTGKARSWKDLGGRRRPVTACTERVGSGRATVNAFRMLVLDGAAYGPVLEKEDPADCIAWLTSEPDGVTVATVALARDGIRALPLDGRAPTAKNVKASIYPATRPLLLVSRTAPTGGAQKLFEFVLSPEGQAIVAGSGFVPAR